jgi:IrrE N-terminal-like domain
VNKAELARHALELRAEIGLRYLDVLDPYKLAKQWGIDVFQLSDSTCSRVAREHFLTLKRSVFSGMLIPVSTGAVILENDAHDPLRRRSTMGHEMAHVVRWHTFTSGVVAERGCRLSSPEDEAEAALLGAELLVPTKAANWMAFRDYTDEQVATKFEVSTEIARWRMNASGARRFATNARRKVGR